MRASTVKTTLTLLTARLLTPLGAVHAADSAPAPLPDHVDVLVGGQGGYRAYRIPSLIVAPNGDLLVFCEARKVSLEDDGDIDLVQTRSADGGKTWTPHQLIHEEGGSAKISISNPTAVVDKEKGTIWLATNRNLLNENGARSGGALVTSTSF